MFLVGLAFLFVLFSICVKYKDYPMGVLLIGLGMLSLYFSVYATHYGYSILMSILFSVPAFILFGFGSGSIKNKKRRNQPSADQLLGIDSRPSILLLRSFKRDYQEIKSSRLPGSYNMLNKNYYVRQENITFEEELEKRLNEFGPVVALGRPGERLQPLGASRNYVSDGEWRNEVCRLAKRSGLAVIIADDTEHVRWEIQEMHKILGLSRIIFVLPPDYGKKITRPSEWYKSWTNLRQQFDFLPEVNETVGAIGFNESGKAYLIRRYSLTIAGQLDSLSQWLSARKTLGPNLAQPKNLAK